jgi:hypothetical protein
MFESCNLTDGVNGVGWHLMDWLKQNWGSLLSAIGLLITYFTFRAAKDAALEVKKARDDFRRETILSLTTAAYQLSQEIETLLSLAAYPAALVRSRDLGKSLGFIIKRWEFHHTPTTLTILVEIRTQVESLTRLQRTNRNPTNAEQLRLLDVMQQVSNKLGDEKAAAEARRTDEN